MILKENLRGIVRLQREELNLTDTGITRELLMRIDQKIPHIVVLIGIRRCGKSTLLSQIIKQLDSYYYFNFEDPRAISFELMDFNKMDTIFSEEFGESRDYFFDEIQNIPDWERFIRRLQDRGKKVYITGSNASLLSRELGSRLTGRHLMYELFPFSFYEMLHMRGIKPSSETFMTYCRMGGFPEFLKYENIEILHQLFRDIITRDIIGRYQIREPKILLELAVYLITNTGKEFTYNRLKNHFQLGSINTAIAYVAHLEECFLFFTLPKFDYSFSKQRTHAKKIYAIDPGLIRANSVLMSEDSGRIFENIVFLELRRRYQEIFYFKNNDECDFLVKTGNSVEKAIQVCYQLTEENISREMIGLREAMELTGAKQGMILTFDQEDEIEGIPVIPVWKWCSEDT